MIKRVAWLRVLLSVLLTWKLNEAQNQKQKIFALSLVGFHQKQAEICRLMTLKGKKPPICVHKKARLNHGT
jgi:hypothetical protein